MILKYITGPLVGAAIGYCTNYLAVKMMFYPKKEITIHGYRLPFTPGAIPKGKPRLAKAIGEIVGKSLLTKEDIVQQLLSEEIEEKIADNVIGFLCKDVKQELLILTGADEERYNNTKEQLSSMLCDEIISSVSEIGTGDIIAQEIVKVLKNKVKGTMLEMFFPDDAVKSIANLVGEKIQDFICNNGKSYIQPVLDNKIQLLEETATSDILARINMPQADQRDFIKSVYQKIINGGMEMFGKKLDIPVIIENKINAMDMDELENMVLGVMKKELDTIVNLGALIGFLLGIINIFI